MSSMPSSSAAPMLACPAGCELAHVIREHVPAVMQLMTVELREYNMQLVTTKCLNTAVMLMYLMLGADALLATRACEVPRVRATTRATARAQTLLALRDELLSPDSERALFYVMLTDGEMLRPEPRPPAPIFPGHVFVIEKERAGTFRILQSYIYAYDLAQHVGEGAARALGADELRDALDGLVHIAQAGEWDAGCTAAWAALTHTSPQHSARWEGARPGEGTLLPCYKRVRTDGCLEHLYGIVQGARTRLHQLPDAELDAVFGEADMFPLAREGEAPRPAPLSRRQMLRELDQLHAKVTRRLAACPAAQAQAQVQAQAQARARAQAGGRGHKKRPRARSGAKKP